MSPTIVDQFRFMDLPAEIRRNVYVRLFSMTNFSISPRWLNQSRPVGQGLRGMALLLVSNFIFDECWQLLYQHSTFHHRNAWQGYEADLKIRKTDWGYNNFASAPEFLRAGIHHLELWAESACRVVLDPNWNRAFNVAYPNVKTVKLEWVWYRSQRRKMSDFQAFIHGTQPFDWEITMLSENPWGFHDWMFVIAPGRLVRVCRSRRYGTKRTIRFLQQLGFSVDTSRTPIEEIDGLFVQR